MNTKGVTFRVKVLIIALVIIIAAVTGSIAFMTPKKIEEVRIGFLASLTGVLAPLRTTLLFCI